MENWIVVVDSDDVSKRQMDVCRALRPSLQGAVECHLPDNAEATVCKDVKYFPAFCNTTSNECVYGLRTEQSDFDELIAGSGASPQTTTQPVPPQTKPKL